MTTASGCLLRLLLVSLFACSGVTRGADGTDNIKRLMVDANTPGLALAKIEDGKLKTVAWYGETQAGSGEPVGARTAFEAASLTKTMFAVIVIQLVDEGVIDLDERIAATFDYERITDADAYARLTPRQVLTHTTGMPNWAGDPANPEPSDIIRFVQLPGEKFGYSGEGFQLLQAFVEARTEKTFASLFAERLGHVMPDTTVVGIRDGLIRPTGYSLDDDGSRVLTPRPAAKAAYSAITTATDYARFLIWLREGAGMSAELVQRMFEPQSHTDNSNVSWALGWGVQKLAGKHTIFHWGDNGQFTGFVAFDEDINNGIVFFTTSSDGLRLIEELAEPVVGDLDPVIEWLGYGRVK